jgi:NADH:ubiquinone oxidoreductase subunit F (NADH-binding)
VTGPARHGGAAERDGGPLGSPRPDSKPDGTGPDAAGEANGRPEGSRWLLPELPQTLEQHLDAYGAPPFAPSRSGSAAGPGGPAELITVVEESGLTGRGGAGFPAGRKMRAVLAATRHGGPFRAQVGAVLIANGCESEPASDKDRTLLSRAPHLVIDGIALAAEAVGATRAYLCVPDDRGPVLHPPTTPGPPATLGPLAPGPPATSPDLPGLRAAITSRERAGLNRVPLQVVGGPAGYVSSQETALIGLLNGTGARPAFVPPRPSERGVGRHPTLVLNVETLAHIALIARHGAGWFRQAGPATAPGTTLVTVSGAVARPGVYEIVLGTTIGTLIDRAGGVVEPVQAVLAGGYFGGWLAMPAAGRIPLTRETLRAAGADLGPGVLVVLPEASCPLAETARVTTYLAGQSARQCGPCSNGLPALAEALGYVAFGRPRDDVLRWTEELLGLVAGRGACHLPDGTAGLVRSALVTFAADLRRHAGHGPCGRAARSPVLPLPGQPPGTAPSAASGKARR